MRTRTSLLAVALLASCASIDFDGPRTPSHAMRDTADTRIGQWAAEQPVGAPGESGFHLLSDGVDALALRLILATGAERCIDAQYYLITDDAVGRLFVAALLRAADRGVRVRLLVDDIQTKGYDAGMAALDAHPAIEVRVYNPFAHRGHRWLDALIPGGFRRVNRRMHNKSFTVDGKVTIIGGRNIAGEYFGAREDVDFADLDVLAVGPVVDDVADMFDTYWNHRRAVPVTSFAEAPEDAHAALDRVRAFYDAAVEEIRGTHYAEALRAAEFAFLEGKEDHMEWIRYDLVYDAPDKPDTGDADSIVGPLFEVVAQAEHELVIISPYFVPLRSGVEGLGKLVDKGVRVHVVTNSLAANNHAVAHSGYAPFRRPLLDAGVELYEVRADAVPGADVTTLHAKAFAVDRETLFIGSFNWDPRSAHLNTELGVILHSPELVEEMVTDIHADLPSTAYRVTRAESGGLRWWDGERVHFRDPEAGFWRRVAADLLSLLPIKGQI